MDIFVTDEIAGANIREYLRGRLGYSSAMLKKLKFTDGGIKVNGRFVTVRYTLCAGDVLSLACEDTYDDTCPYILPVELPLEIVYEDEHITVINKPPDMSAHPSFSHRLDTAANALAYHYRGKPYVFRPVNRLDRDTSGLMLTANSRLAASKLYRQMISGDISKSYTAVLDYVPSPPSGEIITHIRRAEGSIMLRKVCSEDCGKLCITKYELLRTTTAGRGVVSASPVTGRTHQLRVHFAHIGCPITGDSLYGSVCTDISRHALHAQRLSFFHPETGERLEFTAALPDDIAGIAY